MSLLTLSPCSAAQKPLTRKVECQQEYRGVYCEHCGGPSLFSSSFFFFFFWVALFFFFFFLFFALLLFFSFSFFLLQHTIEEKVIERAYEKLALDALVIQQGRLAEQKAVNKDELLQMVRYGAEKVFSSSDSSITDEDVDRILAKGEEAKAELDEKMKKFTQDAIEFKMDDCQCLAPLPALLPSS